MGIDSSVFEWIAHMRTPEWDAFMMHFTLLGNWPFLFLMAAIVSMLLCRYEKKEKAIGMFLNVWGGALIVTMIKYSVQRLRPELGLVEEIGFSFPSAHAFLSFSFYGFLLILLWKSKVGRAHKYLGSLLLFSCIVLISFSRIYLGVHWFSDVVGGLVLSVWWMWVVGRYTPRKRFHP
jgi:undecaprenyl-diphosphatase